MYYCRFIQDRGNGDKRFFINSANILYSSSVTFLIYQPEFSECETLLW